MEIGFPNVPVPVLEMITELLSRLQNSPAMNVAHSAL